MTLSITFPRFPDVPAELPLLATVAPRWTTDAIAELGRRFGIVGEQVDSGTWTVLRDERAALEVYNNSSSYRFERLDVDGEGRKTPADIGKDEAVKAADLFVDQHSPRGVRPGKPVVTEQVLLVSEREGIEPTSILSALQVSYRYAYEGLDLLGPGAKTQVTVGAQAEVFGAYRFWRDLRPSRSIPTLSPDEAAERFSASDLFAQLDDKSATCTVTDVRLGYLTRPPTEPQGALLPTYEFRGVLSTEALPRYEFTGYVLGGRLDDSLAKWAGRVGSFARVPA